MNTRARFEKMQQNVLSLQKEFNALKPEASGNYPLMVRRAIDFRLGDLAYRIQKIRSEAGRLRKISERMQKYI